MHDRTDLGVSDLNTQLPGRIAVITGDPSLPDPTKYGHRYGPEDLAVHDAMRTAMATLQSLESRVFESHATMFDDLEDYAPDLVMNFCDTGLGNRPDQEIHVATQLEVMGLPYSGATPRGMVLCFDKQIVRLIAESLGVAVPRERFIPADKVAESIIKEFPVLIKPNTADGSVGITKDAVVHDSKAARNYLDWLANELPGKDVLVQEFLPGTEYGLGVIGNADTGLAALPMLEVDYSGLPNGLTPILSFESKADPNSPYWSDIRYVSAGLSAGVQQQLADNCRRLFARLGLRDYGRFDFRVDAQGTIKLMEVNPNPAWGYDAKLALMASVAGWRYADLLEKLIGTAWARVRPTA